MMWVKALLLSVLIDREERKVKMYGKEVGGAGIRCACLKLSGSSSLH